MPAWRDTGLGYRGRPGIGLAPCRTEFSLRECCAEKKKYPVHPKHGPDPAAAVSAPAVHSTGAAGVGGSGASRGPGCYGPPGSEARRLTHYSVVPALLLSELPSQSYFCCFHIRAPDPRDLPAVILSEAKDLKPVGSEILRSPSLRSGSLRMTVRQLPRAYWGSWSSRRPGARCAPPARRRSAIRPVPYLPSLP